MACKNSLRRISLESADSNDVFLPLGDLKDVVSIDYHFNSGTIFYIEAGLKQIKSFKLTNQNLSQLGASETYSVQTVISHELGQPNSLAVDWIASNLYWSDQEKHLISIARFDGSSRKVLIDLDLGQPKCLQLLPDLGFMFWIDTGGAQKIERGKTSV